MTTDTIRQKFEAFKEEMKPYGFDAFDVYKFAYQQGQRDLIEALKPVGYMSHVTIRTISCGKPATAYPVASSWVKYPLYILPEHAQKIREMGFLPENTPK